MARAAIDTPLEILDGPGGSVLKAARDIALVLRNLTGREFGIARIIRSLAAAIPSWERILVTGPDGDPFSLNLRHGGFSVVMSGYRTEAMLAIIDRLPSKITVLDIGANIGAWTRVFSSRFDRVIAFEPSPGNFTVLSDNCAQKANVECVQVALSDRGGKVAFCTTGAADMHHIAPDGEIEVASYRLDDFLSDPVGFMKIDVEGFEEEVLAGASRVIEQHRPTILFEFIPWLAEERSKFHGRKIMTLLAERGYVVRRVAANGSLHSEMEMEQQHGWTNDYLALIPGSDFETRLTPLFR